MTLSAEPWKPRDASSGFSLLEIIVAMAILALLVGAAIPVVSVSIDRSKKKETREELNALKEGVEAYFHDVWVLPGELGQLLENKSKVKGWAGPYINPPLALNSSTLPDISKDAWNQDYILKYTGSSGLEIQSPGPDGTPKTSDDIIIQVDVTYIRRESTIEELEIINSAIQTYNKAYLGEDPLPPDWDLIVSKLVFRGFLPAGNEDLETDGWGQAYQPDPLKKAPVVRVTSANLEEK